jgi:hypothetical protein
VSLEFSFDRYSLRARLAPVLIVLSPLGALAATFVNWQSWSAASSALVGVLATFGPATLLTEFGRDRGKEKQQKLFELWGGKPSTVMLRHTSKSLNALTLARYHERLRQLLPDLLVPSAEQEMQNPTAADTVYESCADYLRTRTKDTTRYERLFSQNVSFGYRRNLWAMKPFALVLLLICLLASLSVIGFSLYSGQSKPFGWLCSALIDGSLLAAWVRIVRPEWVRVPADEYARQLLSACEELEPRPTSARLIKLD